VKDHHRAGNGLPHQHGQDVGRFECRHLGELGRGSDA
jgi:hypothetical protein